jgi:hypothetical protein
MSHRLSEGDTAMGYGHAERNLALIRQLEAETRDLLETLDQLDPEQSAWLQEVTSPRKAGASSALARNSNGVSGHLKGEVAAAQVLTTRPPPASVPPLRAGGRSGRCRIDLGQAPVESSGV